MSLPLATKEGREAAIARAMRLRGRHRTDGQALPEFALVLPVFLLIFFAIIQFGVLLAAHIGLTNAVREVARYGSTVPTTDGAPAGNVAVYLLDTALPGNVATYNAANLEGSSVSYCRYADASGAYSIRLTVAVTYDHPLFVPLVSTIIDGLDGNADNAFALVTSEAMRVENPPLGSAPPLPDCP